MFGIEIAFVRPWYLVLLVLLPALWVFSFRSLAGLGRFRRLFALAFRTLVFVLIVLALAEVQMLRTSDRLTVIYLLDQSESIPAAAAAGDAGVRPPGRASGIATPTARRLGRRDRVRPRRRDRSAAVRRRHPVPASWRARVELRTDATNLAAAMKLAQATFPEDSAKRIVIVTDGNENLGDARAIAAALAEEGIGIDVVPIQLASARRGAGREGRAARRHPPRPAVRSPRGGQQPDAAGRRQRRRRGPRAN